MSRARTYTKSEITDAAEAAANHNVRVIMHPSGEIEFSPRSFAAKIAEKSSTDDVWEKWQHERKARGGA